MEVENIIKEANQVFARIFDDDSVSIGYDTTAADIEDWDSLNHIQLVVALEKHFKIRFTSAEIQNFQNVGGMCEVIKKKLESS